MLSENKNHSKYITWNYYFSNLKNNNQKLKKVIITLKQYNYIKRKHEII